MPRTSRGTIPVRRPGAAERLREEGTKNTHRSASLPLSLLGRKARKFRVLEDRC